MKKLCMLLLCCLFAALTVLPVLADVTPVEAEAAIPFLATAEEDFQGGILIVNMKHEYSYPNKVWNKIHFGNPKHVAACVDLTACDDPAVIASYQQNQHFRQILEVYLDTYDKQTAIDVANQFAASSYVFSVGINYLLETEEEPIASADTLQQISSSNVTLANQQNITPDPLLPSQYSIFNIQANKAWAITKGSPSVIVGVIDTGIDPIPDLTDNLVPGYDMREIKGDYDHEDTPVIAHMPAVGDTEPYYDGDVEYHHGTKVASVIASAQNTIGLSGIAPNVKIMPLRVASEVHPDPIPSAYVRAFVMAQNLHLPIVNFSVNSNSSYKQGIGYSYDIRDYGWLPALQNYQGLIVNSAGNFGMNVDYPVDLDEGIHPTYPGEFRNEGILNNLLVVGTVNYWNEWCVSNWGKESVDLMAPGQDIITAYGQATRNTVTNEVITIQTKYQNEDGSSFSAPMVTATAALLLSYNPNLTVQQLKNAILNTVTVYPALENRCNTSGVLNVYNALLSVANTKMNNYCVTVSAAQANVSQAYGVVIEYPQRLQLIDVYINSYIEDSVYSEVSVDLNNRRIELSFGGVGGFHLDQNETAFTLWFAEPVGTPLMAMNAFDIDISNTPMGTYEFLLGDINADGYVDSDDLSWMDFLLMSPNPSYLAAGDVNHDGVFDVTDKAVLQQFVNGTIKTLY